MKNFVKRPFLFLRHLWLKGWNALGRKLLGNLHQLS